LSAIAHHTLASGTRIDCFEIRRVLGVGGFGVTYQGYDHTLSCDVAIKEYLPSGIGLRAGDGITVVPKSDQDQEIYNYGLDRFLEEARVLAKFKVPSIVRVARFLECNGTAYLIMDYEDGESLSSYLKAVVTLSEGQILSILRLLLEGLRHVHAKGYLHRDIKPGNIYLRKDGSPVLLDFGAARQSICNHSKAVTCMVTPGYAPFEQYNNSGKQGPWTDLYGLGATLYRCIANKDPASASERIMALNDGESDPLIPARVAGKGRYSEMFLDIVDWMLRPAAADRPQSVDDVLARLTGSEPGTSGDWVDVAGLAAGGTPSPIAPTSATHWADGVLDAVERNLTAHLGPVARTMVKTASARARSLEELYTLLAESVPPGPSREDFLKNAPKQRDPSLNSGPVSAGRPSQGQGQPSQRTLALTDEMVQRAERALAMQVGPLARVLVRRAAETARNGKEFLSALEREIDSDEKRQRFLQAMKGLVS